ncbi:hypothetical protein EMCRGX_G003790 [Ephydatia muelleri]
MGIAETISLHPGDVPDHRDKHLQHFRRQYLTDPLQQHLQHFRRQYLTTAPPAPPDSLQQHLQHPRTPYNSISSTTAIDTSRTFYKSTSSTTTVDTSRNPYNSISSTTVIYPYNIAALSNTAILCIHVL